VVLSLANEGNFPDRNWDVSFGGYILVSKKEFKYKHRALEGAKALIEEWNNYLSGNVYCCVLETYNLEKESINYDVVCGFSGYKHALEELKTFGGN
jgi:hypothetical protein